MKYVTSNDSRIRRVGLAFMGALIVASAVAGSTGVRAAEPSPPKGEGVLHMPAFDFPQSAFLSEETRAALKNASALVNGWPKPCPSVMGANQADLPGIRKCEVDGFYKTPLYADVRKRYDVSITSKEIGGVYTEIVMPSAGISRGNQKRVLINVHGGGFQGGSRTFSQLESVPIAAVGKIKIISVDYRMAPEFLFPAGLEDIAAVYREVLKSYKPENIGIYGCSAGGQLIAESMAWFQKHNLPSPGAIGIFCAGADSALDEQKSRWVRSDSAHIQGALSGQNYDQLPSVYYKDVDHKNPVVSPADYEEVMAKFPPSLFISGTRDFLLSSALATHAQLTRLGIRAELHVWEGMSHAFLYFPEIPESRESYDVIVRFFDRHLGK